MKYRLTMVFPSGDKLIEFFDSYESCINWLSMHVAPNIDMVPVLTDIRKEGFI